jgi:eukaryotic-like serine/threonine-protein kinase
MSTAIKLVVKDGDAPIRELVFSGPTRCTVGRSGDCEVLLPNDELHWNISRHHCQLDIDPPMIRVRDLGSLNGTYVNGQKIGQRDDYATPVPGILRKPPEVELRPGDVVRVGHTVLQIATGTTPAMTDSASRTSNNPTRLPRDHQPDPRVGDSGRT